MRFWISRLHEAIGSLFQRVVGSPHCDHARAIHGVEAVRGSLVRVLAEGGAPSATNNDSFPIRVLARSFG